MVITGNGILAFGFWGVIKAVLYLIVRRKEILQELFASVDETGLGRELVETIILIIFCVMMGIMVLVITWTHAYVGLHARAEGLGRKHSSFYLFVAIILIVSSVGSVLYEIWSILAGNKDSLDMIASALVDLTVIITLLQMIKAARKVKAYRKAQGETE